MPDKHTPPRGRPFTPDRAAECGRRGGLTTVARHGHGHMRQIAARGFVTTVRRHWGGDRQAYLRHLQQLGLLAQDPMPWNGAWTKPPRVPALPAGERGIAVYFTGPANPWPEEPPF